MILRTPQCDDDRCDYDTTGWVHDPGCRTQNGTSPAYLNQPTGQDWRDATDYEDGVAHYRRPAQLPARQQTPIGEAA